MLNSRKLSDLNADVIPHAEKFIQECAESGIDVVITSTKRDQEYQDYLYQQGRTRPGKIVTWTHKSRHISGNALDFAIRQGSKIAYDVKADYNKNSIADYFECGEIAKRIGFKWGGDFKTPDYGHVEMMAEG